MDGPDETDETPSERHDTRSSMWQVPIELSPTTHRKLSKWCRDLAADLDGKAVSLGELLETMINLMLVDPRTAEAVRTQIANATRQRKL